jgi:5-oxopent-3-ene-1,2,5-tricarboxylate decarboxylase / 2-hydroxyhepta-2,4-diene-1,7-dioate isomerase
MSTAQPFMPTGTVYGTLLNFQGEMDALAPQMSQAPYKAAPRAPVLYVKTANTWSANGSGIVLPSNTSEVEIGATIGVLIGPPAHVKYARPATFFIANYVLMNDLSIPHASFFRPPVKYKCVDGFLGVGSQLMSAERAGDPARFKLEVHINGELRQRIDFANLVRSASQLQADVSEFMTLQAGDILMLGCDTGRPLAQAGDRIDIHAPGLPAFGTLSNTLLPPTSPNAIVGVTA